MPLRGSRVLILAPLGRDAECAATMLEEHGVAWVICASMLSAAQLVDEQAGAVLATEEAFARDSAVPLIQALRAQPKWSDLPFVLLAAQRQGRLHASEQARRRLPPAISNVVVLERPMGRASLLSAIDWALTARRRQFQLGDHVEALERQTERLKASELALRDAAEGLERRVMERTAALQREIAERQRAEEALRQSQKMEAVGQLTGGIAHDFNNMLTGVIGSLAILKRRIDAGRYEQLDRYMEAATASAQRAASLTHRLLAFSRRQSLDIRAVDLDALVSSMHELLQRTLGESIELRVERAPALPWVRADANQLESALLNLAINARDAMPEGGRLTISTEVVTSQEATARTDVVPFGTARADAPAPGRQADAAAAGEAERQVLLRVTDTGVGMSPQTLAKAFDPFFTTKPIGQGTGLGLSMIYGYMKQSGGNIRLASIEGQGTSVDLLLPVATQTRDALGGHDLDPAPLGAGETVLVVEDDASVRMLVMDVLNELGYAALEAAEPQAAIQLLESDRRIDLMVSDVGLPGINGRQLAEIARQRRPDLRVLFVTGYARDAVVRSGFLGRRMDMMSKPFSLEALAVKIRHMMVG